MRIAFIARQPGTAHVFRNWLIHLKREKAAWLTRVFFYPEAAGHIEGEPIIDDGRLRQELKTWTPQCLVTGTSLLVAEDANCWSWARNSGIPCLAVVESWVNLPERFLVDGVLQIPDLIAVPDLAAASALIKAGVGMDKTREIGNPLLEEARQTRHKGPSGDKLLFVTEPPLPEMGEAMFRQKFHQLDSDLFAHLIVALRGEPALKARLSVRLHPRDTKPAWMQRVRESLWRSALPFDEADLDFHWDQESKAQSLNLTAVVVGLGSMLLHEAAAAGIPVVALRLTAAEPFPELIVRPDVCRVEVQGDICAHLRALCFRARPGVARGGQEIQAPPSWVGLINVIEEMAK